MGHAYHTFTHLFIDRAIISDTEWFLNQHPSRCRVDMSQNEQADIFACKTRLVWEGGDALPACRLGSPNCFVYLPAFLRPSLQP